MRTKETVMHSIKEKLEKKLLYFELLVIIKSKKYLTWLKHDIKQIFRCSAVLLDFILAIEIKQFYINFI